MVRTATTATKKTPATKTAAQKVPRTKTPVQKAAATKAAATKAAAKQSAAKKVPAKKAAARKVPATKAAARKVPATKAAARKAPATKAAARKAPLTTAAAAKAPAKKAAATKAAVAPGSLSVHEHESPWTTAELKAVRTELTEDMDRLNAELAVAEDQIADLIRDNAGVAGDDPADAGSKAFEREHAISLANNARELLAQNARALARIDDGSYGSCESCGRPIGKARLQAFPRATLCVSCKQQQERQH